MKQTHSSTPLTSDNQNQNEEERENTLTSELYCIEDTCDTITEINNMSNEHSREHSFERSYQSNDPLLVSLSSSSVCSEFIVKHNNNAINRKETAMPTSRTINNTELLKNNTSTNDNNNKNIRRRRSDANIDSNINNRNNSDNTSIITNSMNATSFASTSPFSNWNVRFVILYNFCDGAAMSVWSAQLLSLLLYKWTSSTSLIGWAATLSGVSQIVGATVAAWMSGHGYKRQTTIRLAALWLGCALCTYLVSITCHHVWMLCLAQPMFGAYCGLASTSTEALFADSVHSGERSNVYNFKWMVQTLCYVVGYTLTLIMLACWGNDWSETNIQHAMYGGLLFHFSAIIWLCLLGDKYVVNSDALMQPEISSVAVVVVITSTPATHTPVGTDIKDNTNNNNDNNDMNDDVISTEHNWDDDMNEVSRYSSRVHLLSECTNDVSTNNNNNNNNSIINNISSNRNSNTEEGSQTLIPLEQPSENSLKRRLYSCVSWNAVPYFVCLVDFLMAAGTGMILQYFPLFLVEQVELTPTMLYEVYLTSTILTSCVSSLVRYVADNWLGRLPVVMVTRLIGITALLCMAQLNSHSVSAKWLMIAFIIRNSTMNAVMGITRSVIMDSVKKENRAKWSAFESFSSFTWAGSAMVGGYIAEAKGYQFSFAITAYVHYAATMLLVPAIIGAATVERNLRMERQQLQQQQQQHDSELRESDKNNLFSL